MGASTIILSKSGLRRLGKSMRESSQAGDYVPGMKLSPPLQLLAQIGDVVSIPLKYF